MRRVTDARVRAALRMILLPPEVKVAIAEAAVGSSDPPPFLDDDVMEEIVRRGFMVYRDLAPEEYPDGVDPGRGDRIAVGTVTEAGWAFAGSGRE